MRTLLLLLFLFAGLGLQAQTLKLNSHTTSLYMGDSVISYPEKVQILLDEKSLSITKNDTTLTVPVRDFYATEHGVPYRWTLHFSLSDGTEMLIYVDEGALLLNDTNKKELKEYRGPALRGIYQFIRKKANYRHYTKPEPIVD